jgi:hypothetical protein
MVHWRRFCPNVAYSTLLCIYLERLRKTTIVQSQINLSGDGHSYLRLPEYCNKVRDEERDSRMLVKSQSLGCVGSRRI